VETIIAWIFLIVFILLYFALIIYVWKKKHPHRKLITFLMLLGPIGISISVVILYRTSEFGGKHP
jgi:amino acid transporter